MRIPFSFLVLACAFAEIAVFILVGRAIGIAATLALTLLGAVAGIMLLRRQGLATLARIRTELSARRPPARALVDGIVQALAAVLIMVPGFLSDAVGILLLVPAARRRMLKGVARWAEARVEVRSSAGPGRGGIVELDPDDYQASPRRQVPLAPSSPRRGEVRAGQSSEPGQDPWG